MRLCWADKLTILWAAIIYGGLFLIAQEKAALFKPDGLYACWQIFYTLILPPWLLLRLVDWVIGGPARRRGEWRISRG